MLGEANLPPWAGLLMAFGIVAINVVLFTVVRRSVRKAWEPVVLAFPAQPIGPGAERRRRQNFEFRGMRSEGAVHLAADARYMHVEPWGPFRWIGKQPVSIPWEAITVTNGRLGRAAAIEGQPVTLPEWCVQIAAGEAPRPGG